MEQALIPATFVVRLLLDEEGAVTGVVERVRTGEKARFTGLDGIVTALGELLAADGWTRHGVTAPRPGGER